MPNVARFDVHSDPWGYRVYPAQEEPELEGDAYRIEVVNNISEQIRVQLTGNVTISGTPSLEATPGETVRIDVIEASPNDQVIVKIWVGEPPEKFRARADSDPRVNPK